ncbi:MAG: hypothetical protein LUH54_00050 [Firmicutes bacterium]|nr:hypothetical protein [Bacillota bacterium]
MKRFLIFILALLCAVLPLASCAGENDTNESSEVSDTPADSATETDGTSTSYYDSGDIVMTVTTEDITTSTETITISFTNNTDEPASYSEYIALYIERDYTWQEVEPIGEWIEPGYGVSAGATDEQDISVKNQFGSLEAGEYKIIKTFSLDEGAVEVEAYFTVGE